MKPTIALILALVALNGWAGCLAVNTPEAEECRKREAFEAAHAYPKNDPLMCPAEGCDADNPAEPDVRDRPQPNICTGECMTRQTQPAEPSDISQEDKDRGCVAINDQLMTCPPTVEWVEPPPEPTGTLEHTICLQGTDIVECPRTGEVQYGLRSDGVVVWRKK